VRVEAVGGVIDLADGAHAPVVYCVVHSPVVHRVAGGRRVVVAVGR